MLYLLIGVVYYGRKKPAYSHLRDTISELGEKGSWYTRRVSAYFFLPLGGLLWALAIAEENDHIAGLAFYLGAGYVVAAFFPCEKGSHIKGSWQQQLHNLGGLIEYAGSAWFLWRLSESGFVHPAIPPLILACALALSLPVLFPSEALFSACWRRCCSACYSC